MAKKTSLPAGFASKTNYQSLASVPTGQKLNATTEWNLGIQDIADTIDENYERLPLNWTNDVIANQVLATGQRVEYNDIDYRCTTGYDVGAGKTFTPANFQELSYDYKTWYVDLANGLDSNQGGINDPFKQPQAAYNARIADGFSGVGRIEIMTSGTYTGLTATITALSTEIITNQKQVTLGGLTITDIQNGLYLIGINSIGTFVINQTSANVSFVVFKDCNPSGGLNVSGTVNTPALALVQGLGTTVINLASGFPSLVVDVSDGATFNTATAGTLSALQMDRGYIKWGANTGMEYGSVSAVNGLISCVDTTEVTITGTFTHEGTIFIKKEKITVTGTETYTPGEWALHDYKEIYMDATNGSDSGDGSKELPFETLQVAIAARIALGDVPVIIYVYGARQTNIGTSVTSDMTGITADTVIKAMPHLSEIYWLGGPDYIVNGWTITNAANFNIYGIGFFASAALTLAQTSTNFCTVTFHNTYLTGDLISSGDTSKLQLIIKNSVWYPRKVSSVMTVALAVSVEETLINLLSGNFTSIDIQKLGISRNSGIKCSNTASVNLITLTASNAHDLYIFSHTGGALTITGTSDPLIAARGVYKFAGTITWSTGTTNKVTDTGFA